MSPRVSVVMPAYQAEATIGASISSVLWQTYRDVEVVVVDDGSTDATARVASSYGPPVRVVQQPNGGVPVARNRGIAEAAGELIAFCDADDVLFPQYLEALAATFDDNGGLATSNAYWLFPGGITPSKVRYKGRFPPADGQRRAILEQNFVWIMSMFPRALVDQIGPFDEELRRAEDWDFWMRAIFAGRRVALQPRPMALVRWGATGLSSAREAMGESVRAVLQKADATLDLTPDERAYVRRRLSGPGPQELARNADAALLRGRYSEAARMLREAASLCPSERPLVWKARLMSAGPGWAGPLLRARQKRLDDRLATDERHVR